jgi:hypothetical protein
MVKHYSLFLVAFFITDTATLYSMNKVHRIAHRKFCEQNLQRKKQDIQQEKYRAAWYHERSCFKDPLIDTDISLAIQNSEELADTFEVVKGDLALQPGGLTYFYTSRTLESRERSGNVTLVDEKNMSISEDVPVADAPSKALYDLQGNALEIKTDDIMATVIIQSEECAQWGRYTHPVLGEFPLKLPASLIVGKKEGDRVSFLFQKIDSNKRFKVELTCRQRSAPYCVSENFETTLAAAQTYLRKIPQLKVQMLPTLRIILIPPANCQKKSNNLAAHPFFTAQEIKQRSSCIVS